MTASIRFTTTNGNRVAKGGLCPIWDEYRVKFWENGKRLNKASDYFTTDLEDAASTALHWVNQAAPVDARGVAS